jgi:hypothetical protein
MGASCSSKPYRAKQPLAGFVAIELIVRGQLEPELLQGFQELLPRVAFGNLAAPVGRRDDLEFVAGFQLYRFHQNPWGASPRGYSPASRRA